METRKQPNILWLCTDQQRCDMLGCYGNKFVRTPNIDRLAENGMQGRSFYNMLCGDAPLDKFRDDVFCEYYKTKLSGELVAFSSMICDGHYKLTQIHALAPSYPQENLSELYDLENDPNERNNVYNDPEYINIKLQMLERFSRRQALLADPLAFKSAPW